MLSAMDPKSLLSSPGTSLCKAQQHLPNPGTHPGHVLTSCLGKGWCAVPPVPPTPLVNPTVITVSVCPNKTSCAVSKSHQKATTVAAYQIKGRCLSFYLVCKEFDMPSIGCQNDRVFKMLGYHFNLYIFYLFSVPFLKSWSSFSIS